MEANGTLDSSLKRGPKTWASYPRDTVDLCEPSSHAEKFCDLTHEKFSIGHWVSVVIYFVHASISCFISILDPTAHCRHRRHMDIGGVMHDIPSRVIGIHSSVSQSSSVTSLLSSDRCVCIKVFVSDTTIQIVQNDRCRRCRIWDCCPPSAVASVAGKRSSIVENTYITPTIQHIHNNLPVSCNRCLNWNERL